MSNTVFTGVGTAVITPMNADGSINFGEFARVLDYQVEHGADAVVVCGTTGEASTMPDDEHIECIRFAVEKIAKRIPVIAGTGSNDTAHAISLSKRAQEAGADALLQVTPYYNKTSQRGLAKHFLAIADSVNLPIILYNVPSRTGVGISIDCYCEVAKHPNIVAAKEASGDMTLCAKIAAYTDLDIYSGNDDEVVPLLSVGGSGVISVLSNVFPKETSLMCKKFFDGDIKGALELQFKYLPLIKALFSEVNPIPAKAAMAAMGYCEDYLRLPLTPMEDAHKAVLLQCMREQGLDV